MHVYKDQKSGFIDERRHNPNAVLSDEYLL